MEGGGIARLFIREELHRKLQCFWVARGIRQSGYALSAFHITKFKGEFQISLAQSPIELRQNR